MIQSTNERKAKESNWILRREKWKKWQQIFTGMERKRRRRTNATNYLTPEIPGRVNNEGSSNRRTPSGKTNSSENIPKRLKLSWKVKYSLFKVQQNYDELCPNSLIINRGERSTIRARTLNKRKQTKWKLDLKNVYSNVKYYKMETRKV